MIATNTQTLAKDSAAQRFAHILAQLVKAGVVHA